MAKCLDLEGLLPLFAFVKPDVCGGYPAHSNQPGRVETGSSARRRIGTENPIGVIESKRIQTTHLIVLVAILTGQSSASVRRVIVRMIQSKAMADLLGRKASDEAVGIEPYASQLMACPVDDHGLLAEHRRTRRDLANPRQQLR